METAKVTISGLTPLLMHNSRTSNPLDEYAKALKEVSRKRTKTDADVLEMARIEWAAGLYYEDGKYVIPSSNLDATFVASAKQFKLGTHYKQGASVIELNVPLIFADSNKSPEELFKQPKYISSLSVVVNRSRIIRTRPKFDKWSCSFAIGFDESKLNRQQLRDIIENAGRFVGVCDYRPRYGRFELVGFE